MSGISLQESETNIKRIVQAILQLARGRSDAVGEVTLTPNATTTVVDKDVSRAAVNVGLDSEIFLVPRTASAAAALTSVYISDVGNGTFTITHNSNAAVDRVFGWKCDG